jgi:peptide/nickel transport system permease protein
MCIVSLVWLMVVALAAIIIPWVAPDGETHVNAYVANQGPSWNFPFGTDNIGHNMLSQNLYALRYSLAIGALATFIAFILGSVIGLIAGMTGGWVDQALMRVTDFMFAFPCFYLVMFLVADLGRTIFALSLSFGFVQWAGFARLVRGHTLALRNGELVESARAIGARPGYIAVSYIFPNVVNSLIVFAAFSISNMMVQEAVVSFMGFGLPLPKPSFGMLLITGARDLFGFPWLFWGPAVLFITTLMALIFVGDGLQEALDVKEVQ